MQQIIFEETFCTLCLNTTRDSNCQMIDVIRDVLKIVLPDLSLEETVKHFMCTLCLGKLFAAFNFKAICTDTEDIIFPYINASRTSTVDLKEIFLKDKINGNNQIINILEDQRICRLCFRLVTDEFVALKDVDVGIIDMYIPQVNISATRDPVLCRACFDSLHTHSSFLRNCLDTQEKYNYIDEQSYIKTEEIEIKLEDSGHDAQEKYGCDENQSKEIEIKLKDDEKGDSSPDNLGNETIDYKKMQHSQDIEQIKGKYIHKCEIGSKEHRTVPIPKRKRSRFTMCERFYRCDKCKYKSRFKTNLKRHQLVHEKLSECSSKTKYKNGLEKHKLLHNNPLEIQMYKCDTCSFETKHKGNLKRHQLKHKDPSKIQIYKCDRCSFETKHKGNLKLHQLKHKDPLKIQMYKCDTCSYETKRKDHLKRHQLKHKNPLEIHMYECDTCSFGTKSKDDLKLHQLRHKNPSEIHMYECDTCSFETKCKGDLKLHQLRHKDPSKIQMCKCDICNFETKRKGDLKLHQLRHKGPSEIQMYKCDTCSFESKHKGNLKRHQLRHKNPSEILMYECDTCSFRTKRKDDLKRHQLRHKNPSDTQM